MGSARWPSTTGTRRAEATVASSIGSSAQPRTRSGQNTTRPGRAKPRRPAKSSTREQDAEAGRLSMRGDDFRNASTAPSLMLVHVGHTCGSSVKQFLAQNDKQLNK